MYSNFRAAILVGKPATKSTILQGPRRDVLFAPPEISRLCWRILCFGLLVKPMYAAPGCDGFFDTRQ